MLNGSLAILEKSKCKQTAVTKKADSLDPIFLMEMKIWVLIFHLGSKNYITKHWNTNYFQFENSVSDYLYLTALGDT